MIKPYSKDQTLLKFNFFFFEKMISYIFMHIQQLNSPSSKFNHDIIKIDQNVIFGTLPELYITFCLQNFSCQKIKLTKI